MVLACVPAQSAPSVIWMKAWLFWRTRHQQLIAARHTCLGLHLRQLPLQRTWADSAVGTGKHHAVLKPLFPIFQWKHDLVQICRKEEEVGPNWDEATWCASAWDSNSVGSVTHLIQPPCRVKSGCMGQTGLPHGSLPRHWLKSIKNTYDNGAVQAAGCFRYRFCHMKSLSISSCLFNLFLY